MKIKIILVLLFVAVSMHAEIKLKDKIIDLRGICKFEIGDNIKFADKEFDDSGWEDIFIPSSWEDEGFPGYDGYAWYRIHFTVSSEYIKENLYLILGAVDDVDATYINGNLIGYTGSFPPDYETMYHAERRYLIPSEYLDYDSENVIAVRVYDLTGPGGIVKGKPGIYNTVKPVKLDLEFSGLWKFKIGDNPEWAETFFNDRNWQNITVPMQWDNFGYKEYNGFGWYRKKIFIPRELKDEDLILFLGKIDDMDETFFNGEKIGGTGWMHNDPEDIEINTYDYNEVRAYYIPDDLIKYGQDNQIAVRVYDGYRHGGIYEGPIGIVKRETYLRYKRKYKNTFRDFIKSFFD